MNSWEVGSNSFRTQTVDHWNKWDYSMQGEEGEIHAIVENDWTS